MKRSPNLGELYDAIYDFVEEYLPKTAGKSPETIRSYDQTLNMLTDFLSQKHGVEFWELSFSSLTRELFIEFLNTLEERGSSVRTRNQRRACVCSFIRYAARSKRCKWQLCQEIINVPAKARQHIEEEQILTVHDMNSILATVDDNPNPRLRIRDKAIIVLLFDSAARISEILNLRLRDLNLNRTNPYVYLHGKGDKTRSVEITERTAKLLRAYAAYNEININRDTDEIFFFVKHQGRQEAMSIDNAEKLLKRYAERARLYNPALPRKVHPHLLRHTRATELATRFGIEYASKTLGHTSLVTTQHYVRITSEMMQKAKEKAARSDDNPLKSILNPEQVKLRDKKMIARLYRPC